MLTLRTKKWQLYATNTKAFLMNASNTVKCSMQCKIKFLVLIVFMYKTLECHILKTKKVCL